MTTRFCTWVRMCAAAGFLSAGATGCLWHRRAETGTAPVPVSVAKSDAAALRGEVPEPPAAGLPSLGGLPAGQHEIVIQPDCVVQIKVKEDPTLDGSYPVNDIGAVDLGYVGMVILSNKTEKDAESKIREILKTRGSFRNATVSVRILRASYDKIEVVGAVLGPGVIKIGAGDAISLNDALLRAGGLRPSVTGAKVRIVRGGMKSAVVLAVQGEEHSLVAEDGKPNVPDVFLRNSDFLYVFSSSVKTATPEVGEREIIVLGEVNKPGVYRFPTGEPCTIMHLLFKMGSLPQYANKKKIEILRRPEDGKEKKTVVDAEKILRDGNPKNDVALENGDRVVVPARTWFPF